MMVDKTVAILLICSAFMSGVSMGMNVAVWSFRRALEGED